jgi:VIT1/CCC1 family predicted Fe2+/Mn2+ transporter
MSMAAGEFVSVSSQADTEAADLARERKELADDPRSELAELAAIYAARGVAPALALAVAEQLTARDALGAHARDELGISAAITARPIQAALTSAATFAVGAALPVIAVVLSPAPYVNAAVTASSLVCLTILGGVGARVGGADFLKPAFRVAFWGAIAMGITAGVGALVGRAV